MNFYPGSFIVSGSCMAQAIRVGTETYSYSLLKQAKQEKRYPSELRDSIYTIIRFATFILIPAGILLFIKQWMQGLAWRQVILNTVASCIGMMPSGLVLLTSSALAVSSMLLARKKVLVQELYCIETLARVDTLCLDKTGTITQGTMKVVSIDNISIQYTDDEIKRIIADCYTTLDDDNFTAKAIRQSVGEGTEHSISHVPFSSARKGSAVCYEQATYIIGAYNFVCTDINPEIEARISQQTKEGNRVLVLAKGQISGSEIKGNHQVLALICITDVLRDDIEKTIAYFKKQDVAVKVISGDDAQTVAAISHRAGIDGKAIDMSTVKDVQSVMEEYSIFGRVSPEQKKEMVVALKQANHTVAMTGDGVNDIMALREADCSIAMGAGSQAPKSIAQLVLLDNQFSAMPSILLEGRRVINNIQRSASLFLVKTLFSFGLTILSIFWLSAYPFQPIQLSLVSLLGIGLPGFVLTFEPNRERVKGSFLKRVFGIATPGALAVILSIVICHLLRNVLNLSSAQFSTISTIVTTWTSLCVLYSVCKPLTPIRNALMLGVLIGFIIGMLFFRDLLYIVPLSIWQILYTIINMVLIPDFLILARKFVDRTLLKNEPK